MAQAVLNRYLAGVEASSAALFKAKELNSAVKKALIKDGSWDESYHSQEVAQLLDEDFDLVIIVSEVSRKKIPEFSENTIVIEIDYEEPNYKNSTEIERFIKTIKMELIPITRDILEL